MTTSVIVAGFGGQGVLFVGETIARAALASGRNTTFFPSYGPEMRGGTANCTVIVSDEPIGSPLVAMADAVIAMNEPSLSRFETRVRPGGVLIVNASRVERAATRSDVRVVRVDADRIAQGLGEPRVANLVLLGALTAELPDVAIADPRATLAATLPEHRRSALAANLAALAEGRALRGGGSAA